MSWCWAPGHRLNTEARGSTRDESIYGPKMRNRSAEGVRQCLLSKRAISFMQRFNVSERDLRPGCRDIQVEGELDLAVAGLLDEVLTSAAAAYTCVLVGLERCDFIDSSGIAVILRAHNRMEGEGNRLAVYAPTAQVLRVLSMTGLTVNGLVFDNVEEAIKAVGAPAEQS